ncbi:hypothetical protein [Actinoplanes solisilvae]|uniref:hypothetical protein n=1 Tax=Actinoplanes solisilvae TaxID=2486853 RepID=UPI000FD9BC8E|nr:hypothetical protein [Actinoplanes solisilvae]
MDAEINQRRKGPALVEPLIAGRRGRADPERIGWRRRLMLRRQGRLDGRMRKPDPIMMDGAPTTAARDLLAGEYLANVFRVRAECAEAIDDATRRVQRLGHDIADLRARLIDVRTRTAETERRKPSTTGPPEREPGDRHHPDDLVRARRVREHAKRLAELIAERRDLEEKLRRAGQEQSETRSRIEAWRRRPGEAETRFAATFWRERALYDQALLRRHPQADLVRPILDNAIPRLPPWPYAESPAPPKEAP